MRLISILLVSVLLTGCGAKIADQDRADSAGYPVTITNCGKSVTFRHMPRRVVTFDIGITEIMFALGLRDRMAGYAMDSDPRGRASSPWRQDFDKAKNLGRKLNMETAQGANADLVFAGWGYGFSQSSGVTPDSLAQQGIPSYLLTESCRDGDHRGVTSPLQALYTDIRNLGKLFRVEDRAERLVRQYQGQVAEAQASIPKNRPRPKVFLYDSGTDTPTSAGRFAAANEIIEKAGGRNIFADRPDTWVQFQWESVAARGPQAILINDYDSGQNGHTPAQKQSFLRGYQPIKDTEAIKQQRFFALPYAALVEGPRNPSAIAALARYLNERFPAR